MRIKKNTLLTIEGHNITESNIPTVRNAANTNNIDLASLRDRIIEQLRGTE